MILAVAAIVVAPVAAAERVTLRIRVELNPARTPGAVLTLTGGRMVSASSPNSVEGDVAADVVLDTKRQRVRLSRSTPRARDALDLVLEPTDDTVLRMDWHTAEAQRDAETVELRWKDLVRGDRQIRLPGHGIRLTISRVADESPENADVDREFDAAESRILPVAAETAAPRLALSIQRDHLVFAPREPLLVEAELLAEPDEIESAEPLSLEWRLVQPGTGRVLSYDYEALIREGERAVTRLSLPLPASEGVVDGEVRLLREGGETLASARFRGLVLSPVRAPAAQSEVGPYDLETSRTALRWTRNRTVETGRIDRALSRLFGRRGEDAPPVLSWRGLEPGRPHRLDLAGTPQRQTLVWADASEPSGLVWGAREAPSSLLLWPTSAELHLAFPQTPSAVALHRPAIVPHDVSPVRSRWWGVRIDRPAEIEELATPIATTEATEAVWLRAVDRLLEAMLVRGENALLIDVTHPEFPLLALNADPSEPASPEQTPPEQTQHPAVPVLVSGQAPSRLQPMDQIPFDRLEVLLRRATAADIAVVPLLSQHRREPLAGLPTAAAEPLLRALYSRYGGHPSFAGIALRLDGDSPWEYRARDEGWSQLAPEFARSRSAAPAPSNATRVTFQDSAWPEWRAHAAHSAWQQLAQRLTRAWPSGRLVLDIHPVVPTPDEARDALVLGHKFDALQARGLSPLGTAPPGRPGLLYLVDAGAWPDIRLDPQRTMLSAPVGWSEPSPLPVPPPPVPSPAQSPTPGGIAADAPGFLTLGFAPAPVGELRTWLARVSGEAVFSAAPPRFVRQDQDWRALHELYGRLPLSTIPSQGVTFGNDGMYVRALSTADLLVLWAINATGLSAEIDLTVEGCPQSLATALTRGGDEPLASPSQPGSRLQTTLSLAPGQFWHATLSSSSARLTAARVRRPPGEVARLSRRIDSVTTRLAELEQLNRQQPGERFASGFEPNAGETLAWEPATKASPWSLDRTTARDGRQAVTLASAESEIVSRELTIARSPQVEVTAWMKAQRNDFPVEIAAETSGGDAAWQDRRKLSIGTGWERKSVVFTLPETARGQPLRVRIRGRAAGRLWVDDVVIQSDTEAAGEYRTLTRTLAAANLAWKDGRYADCDRLLGEAVWKPNPPSSPPAARSSDRHWLTPWRR